MTSYGLDNQLNSILSSTEDTFFKLISFYKQHAQPTMQFHDSLKYHLQTKDLLKSLLL